MGQSNRESKKVMSGLFWVYMENIAAQLVNFIVSIVLARLLEPSYYGTIALVNVFVNIANVFVNSSFSYSLVQKKDADDLDYSTMFWFNLMISFVLYGLLFLCAPLVAKYYGISELSLILRILSIRIPLCAFNSIQLAYVSSHMVFKNSFLSNSGGAILSGVFGIVLAFCGAGIWALVAQSLLNILFNTLLLKIVVKWKPSFIFSLERLKPMLSFGWKLLATGLMFTGYNELRSLVIGKRYSADDLGYYNQGYSFPRFVASNIDSTINRVLFPSLSHQQDNRNRLAEMTRRAAKTSAYIMTPILFGLAIIAKPLVILLLGEKWLPCVPYLQIMCFVWWLQPTQTCSAQALKALGRSDSYLGLEVINKVCGIGLLVYAVFVVDSVIAIALTMFIGQVIGVFVYGFCISKNVGYKIKDQMWDLLLPTLISLIVCIYAYVVSIVISNNLACILVQVVGGGIIYIAISKLFRVDSFNYIYNTLNIEKYVRKFKKK